MHDWAFPQNSSTQPCLWMLEEALPWDGQPGNRWLSWIRPNTMFFSAHLEPSEMGVTAWPSLFWGAPSAQAQGCHRNECILLLSSPPTPACPLAPPCIPHSQILSGNCLSKCLWLETPKSSGKRMLETCKGWSLGEERSGRQPHFYVSGHCLADWPLDFWTQPLGKLTPPLILFTASCELPISVNFLTEEGFYLSRC